MAVVSPSSSSAALVKAVVLPLALALLAVAAATGSSSAGASEDGPAAVAESGGRFSESSLGLGRKLLNISLCGSGTAPDFSCKAYLPFAKNATCCTDAFGTSACYDVGGFLIDKCGSCTTKCKVGEFCCSGVCADLTSDKNNCGICGNKCTGSNTCKLGFCKY